MKITIGQLRHLIREAMVSPSAATENGIALYSFESSMFETHVLYDVTKMFSSVTKSTSDFYTGSKLAIVGAMSVARPEERGEYYQVVDVKADKGYGPLLYDIALSVHGSLSPSTVDVSPAAQKVWNFYRTKRAKGKKADVEFKDKAVKPLPGKRINVRGLRNVHDEFKDSIIDYFKNPANREDRERYEFVKGSSFVPNEFISGFESGLERAALDYLKTLHM